MLSALRDFFRHHPTVVVLAALLGIAGFAFFLNIVEDVITGDSARVDRLLLLRAHDLSRSSDGNWLTPAARAVSLLGNWQALVPLGAALALFARRGRGPGGASGGGGRDWRPFLFYALLCAGCGALVLGFKYLVGRPRPQVVPALEEAPFLSFPSGHAAYALAGWGFAAYLIARRPGVGAPARVLLALLVLVVAGLVGASRVYLAAHYPSDVTGGLLIAVPWLVAVLFAFEARLRRGARHAAETGTG